MAVFAQEQLDSMEFPEIDSLSERGMLAAAEIFNDSATYSYEPLGIGPKFNCLYLMRVPGGQFRAKMVHVGDVETDCGKRRNIFQVAGRELLVRETLNSLNYAHSDFPAVARWDWDSVHKEQYIGIKCGAAWCEVGRPRVGTKPAFVSSPTYLAPPATLTPDARVRVIKGWYDQQLLAIDGDPVATPGRVVGTFFPAPNLKYLIENDFATWRIVGHVALLGPPGHYKLKFNYDRVTPRGRPLDVMNEISFCKGTRSSCTVPKPSSASLKASCGNGALFLSEVVPRWWVRIKSAPEYGPVKIMYKCVVFRGHPGVDIPATARWRWLADDETNWEYCPSAGCCETQTKH